MTAELLGDPQPWTRDALCVEPTYATVNFFPAPGGPTGPAKAICGRCLVRPECLAYAVTHDIRDGVWGGTSGQERRGMKTIDGRRTPAPRHAAAADALRFGSERPR